MANEAETKRWNDERWVAGWPKRERLTETVTPYLVKAIDPRPGQRVCDIGSGGGGLTIALARAVAPGGEAVGVDLSAGLVELARHRAADAGVAARALSSWTSRPTRSSTRPFDLAASQFGVMFFDEPTAAFAAIRRAIAPGGRFVFACWRGVEENPWHVGTALRPLLPAPPVPPPGKSPVGPFALGDDEYVHEILEGAGFGAVESTPHDTTVRAPADTVADRAQLPMMGVAPEREEEALAILERHLERFALGPDEYEYPLAFRVYEAVNAKA